MIQVNPELFKMGGNRTRKAGKTEKVVVPKPLISPHSVKNKLLNRLQERKKNEISETKLKPHILLDSENLPVEKKEDEFFEALGILTDFKKNKMIDNEKQLYEERKRKELLNKTIKNPINGISDIPINLELSPELTNPVSLSSITSGDSSSFELKKYKVDNETPYGCLRNGIKPTLKSITNATRKTSIVSPAPDIFLPNNNPDIQNRQRKLELIKEKIKNLENSSLLEKANQNLNQNEIKPIVTTIINEPVDLVSKAIDRLNNQEAEKPKKITKKTIKRQFTLGKSNIYKKVGVLVTNQQTRRRILEAQKELKHTPIADIKKYLKHQGLIKVGSTASNDILRKMYESAILAGEVTNTNKDTLIHNFLNDDTNK